MTTDTQQIDAQADAVAPEGAVADAGAPAAVETGAQPETDSGSASSAEAADARSPAERIRDEWLKKYGEKDPVPAETDAKAETPDEKPVEDDAERQDDATEGRIRLTDAEFKALPEKARQRIGQLSADLREAQKAAAEIEEYRSDADAMNRLRAFTEEGGMAAEDVSKMLHMGRDLTAGRFQQFLDAVMPFVAQAQHALGQALPSDIQAMVDSGEMTAEAAKRLTVTEAKAKLAETTVTRERTAREATEQQAQAQQHQRAILNAAQQTERALIAEDADYARKKPAIQAQFRMLLDNGAFPKDAAHVEKMIREIHKGVALPPDPTPLKATVPHPTASTATRSAPPPRNTLEALGAMWAKPA